MTKSEEPKVRYQVSYEDASGWFLVQADGVDVARFRDEPEAHQYVTDHERWGY